MKKMNVKKGSACLDVCCGTADWTIALAKATGGNGIVKGLDFSENMLDRWERKKYSHMTSSRTNSRQCNGAYHLKIIHLIM